MADVVDALLLDLLEWISAKPRSYAEVMEAWRTSCPRLPVWEEANERGLVERRRLESGAVMVLPTAAGESLLARRRRMVLPSVDSAAGTAAENG